MEEDGEGRNWGRAIFPSVSECSELGEREILERESEHGGSGGKRETRLENWQCVI